MKKRILSILLVLAMVVSLLSTAAMALDVGVFEDVNEQTDYYDYVVDVLEKEYFIGMSHDPYTYEPNTLLSYAMLYTVLHRLADEEAVDGDGKEVTWYDPHVDFAKEIGLAAADITDAKLAEAVNSAGMVGILNGFVSGYYAQLEDPSLQAFTADEVKDKIAGWCETDTYTRAQAAMIIVELDKALNALKEEEQGDDPNDFIRAAVKGIVADFNAYAKKAMDLNIGTDDHNFTVGNFVTALNAELAAGEAVVNVNATGELYSATVEKLIGMAVEYAIAILGDAELPTVDEVKDIVVDVADSVGVEIPGNTAKEIASDVYNRIRSVGTDIFSNFRNYNGNFCINKISLMNGETVVASVNVTNDKGLTTDGATASKNAAISLAAHIARSMYADLKTQGANGPVNEITLKASVVVEFGTDCPGYAEGKYDNSYVVNMALTLASDMFSYSYDAETNISTLTLIVTEGLQDEYYYAMTEGMAAVLNNATIQSYLDIAVDKAINAGALDALYDIAGEENKDDVDAAVDAWISANSKAGTSTPGAYTPFDYLWLYEGTIVANGDGSYSLAQGKGGATLGCNQDLYALVGDIYAEKVDEQFDEVFDSVDIDMLTSMDFIDGVYELLDESYVNGVLEDALNVWKDDNDALADNSDSAVTLYNYLIENGDDHGLIVGVNTALYEAIITLCDDIAVEAAARALTEAKNTVNDQYKDHFDNAWDTVPEGHTFEGWQDVKFGFVKLPLAIELNKISALTGDFRLYVENLCLSKICDELEINGDIYADASAEKAGSVNTLVDDKLVNLIDEKIEETGYGEYFGVDVKELVDQMIMEVVYNAEYKGISAQEAIAKALKIKTIDGISTIALGNLTTVLNNDTVQNVAAKYGNAYIHYLATAITYLPAKASVTIRDVELSEAGLEAVRAAAAADDAAAVCTAVANLLAELGNDMCLADFDDGEVFTVKYGARTFVFELAIDIQ